jgi:hypothetical protein
MRPLSFTTNEALARQIVSRLCRRPPYGQSWRDFAIREISCALTSAAVRRKRDDTAAYRHVNPEQNTQNLSLESQ